MKKLLKIFVLTLFVVGLCGQVAQAQEDPAQPDLIGFVSRLAPNTDARGIQVSLDDAAECGGRPAGFSTWEIRGELDEKGGLLVGSERPASGRLSFVMLEMHISISNDSGNHIIIIEATAVNSVGWGFVSTQTKVRDGDVQITSTEIRCTLS